MWIHATDFSAADVTTGDYFVTEVDSERKLLDEISKYMPSEVICNEAFLVSGLDLEELRHRLGMAIYPLTPGILTTRWPARH